MVSWVSALELSTYSSLFYQKEKNKKKAHPEKKQINRNSKGVQINALLKRELLVLNFSFQFLISSSAITFTHQQEITCGEEFSYCCDGPALNWSVKAMLLGRKTEVLQAEKVTQLPFWVENHSWNTNIGRLFTIVTKVAKPQEVNFHLLVSIFLSGLRDTFYWNHKHEGTTEVLPKPHHTALTMLFFLADKTAYDVDDQINMTRAVVLHADMVCYWANTTAF